MKKFIMYFIFLALISSAGAETVKTRHSYMMRFPDIYGNTVVFVSGEDIWKAPASGGEAVRLTIHDGSERFPKFSPDGSLIAFTGEYDGNSDVYVMDAAGGNIRRLTYHPGYDEVVGWNPENNNILFRSGRDSYSRFYRLYEITPDGKNITPLILHEAAQGSFSADGKKIAYNRMSRETRTWKRYKGGTAQDIYIYDFDAQKETKITEYKGTDRIPMWIGDKIYFSSDRDRHLNIYAYDIRNETIKQITHHNYYDVRRPSMGSGKIVYELGGNIYLLNPQTGESKQIPIEIKQDAPEVRPYWKNVQKNITEIGISPNGKRALIVARGEIFTVPQKYGEIRNLTQSSGARDRGAVWSPDGKSIAYVSDANGEYQIYVTAQDGQGETKQLTDYKTGYRHALKWSPDSKKIAFTDQTNTLRYIDLISNKIITIDKADFENIDVSLDKKPISDFDWSPDSRFIAYSKMNADIVYQIYIYALKQKKIYTPSNGLYNDFCPTFSKDGKRLFFVSNRRFSPTYGDFEWEMVYKNVAGIYSFALTSGSGSLLPFRSDEALGAKKSKHKSGDVWVSIEFAGLSDRVEALPLPRGNYRHLSVNESNLFFLNKDNGDFNRFEFRKVNNMDLHAYSFKDRKEHLVISGINDYKLSQNGKNIVYKKGKDVGIIKSSEKKSKGENLNLAELKMWYNPREEWRQIYNEAWRLERDFYYEANMHGIDWPAMKIKYEKLLPMASCRQDIRFIVGELIGELNTSHTYVFGGDAKRRAEHVNVGMLGVDWAVSDNHYIIKKIYKVSDWTGNVQPPLAKPGVDVQEGDYLIKVNGQTISADHNIYAYFQGLAGKQVKLMINDKPTAKGAWQVTVKPLSGERTLRYLDWLEYNRKTVDELSNGQIGYIHLPDTYNGSAKIFPKYFYSQTRKKGIIVDGRYNGGGLDPDIFLQRLAKKPMAFWTRRYSHDQISPTYANMAHMVCLTNRQAGSGGDELPYEFRKKGLGKVIGTRSWGGLVGVSMFISLIDGGGLSAPDYRIYDTEGRWIVENEGVTPDIIVDNKPEEMAKGYDAQLRKAVDILLKEIKYNPITWPAHEAYPIDK